MKSAIRAPITLFVYNRPTHTRQTVEALQKNELAKDSDLIIFSDAAKKPEAAEAVREVREYIRQIDGFKSIKIIERDQNWGLANSIIDGVTSVVNEFGRIIVLEDDLVVTPYFLDFMNRALDKYQDEQQVIQVSGYMFPVKLKIKEDALFLPLTTSWGWATWQRAWQLFDPDAKGYAQVKEDLALRKHFNLDGSYDFFSMLEAQLAGQVDSWAIRWYLSTFSFEGLTLYPCQSLIINKGFDGSGTHGGNGKTFNSEEMENKFNPKSNPLVVKVSSSWNFVRRSMRKEQSIFKRDGVVWMSLRRVKKTLRYFGRYIPAPLLRMTHSLLSKGCSKGHGVYLHQTVQMLGASNVAIGNNTCIGEQTWINVNNRTADEIAISIGNNCFIGRRNFFTSGKNIKIGDYALTAVDCKFICSTHIADNPFVPYITSGTTLDGSICVGANCFFGAGAMVLGNVVIGYGSVIGAGSLVTKDVPPFSLVVGSPAKILRRYSFSKQIWIDVDLVTEDDLKDMPSEGTYLEILRNNFSAIAMPVIAAGSDLGNL
jgi:acetyltransferase-like isoleucine patch superfamily enzyme